MEAYLRRLYYELAIATNPHAVASVLQLVGPERLLYGSDWPALDEADVQSLIQVLDSNPLLQPDDRAKSNGTTLWSCFRDCGRVQWPADRALWPTS